MNRRELIKTTLAGLPFVGWLVGKGELVGFQPDSSMRNCSCYCCGSPLGEYHKEGCAVESFWRRLDRVLATTHSGYDDVIYVNKVAWRFAIKPGADDFIVDGRCRGFYQDYRICHARFGNDIGGLMFRIGPAMR